MMRTAAMLLLGVMMLLEARMTLAIESSEEGFKPLFDGKTLEGWQGGKDGYIVQDECIVSQPRGSGNLATVKEYGDFHLKFEFKLTPGANNGIGIRVPDEVE